MVLNETQFTLDAKGAEALGKFKKAVLVAFNACAIKELVKFPDLPELEARSRGPKRTPVPRTLEPRQEES